MLEHFVKAVSKLASYGKLSILIYHQVVAEPDRIRPFEPTAEVFDWHMRLIRRNFNPISLSDAVSALQHGRLPSNAICVTFDDGYLNNLTVATPILQKYRIPATVYVASAFTRGRNMWNDQVTYLFSDACKKSISLDGREVVLGSWGQRVRLVNEWLGKLKYLPIEQRQAKVDDLYGENGVDQQVSLMMNADQLRQLANAGVSVGAHTVNHPILKNLTVDAQRKEIVDCKADLESWLDTPVEHFAYPNGIIGKDLDSTTVDLVKQAGFKSAVVTDRGTSGSSTSPWLLRRFIPWDETPRRFQLRLLKNMIRP